MDDGEVRDLTEDKEQRVRIRNAWSRESKLWKGDGGLSPEKGAEVLIKKAGKRRRESIKGRRGSLWGGD